VLIAGVGVDVPSGVHAQTPTQRVLVLHAYHQGYKWTDDITTGIRSVLGDDPNVDIQVEYMDTKRIFNETYLHELREFYAYKYHEGEIDLVITSDDNAFNFMLENRDVLFPGVPVVFCGVNFFEEQRLVGHRGFTGVNEDLDIRGGLDLALSLHPETREVVIVNDTTTTGQRVHEQLVRVLPTYEDAAGVTFTFLEDVTMDEIQETVSQLPPDSLVFYTLFFRDAAGAFFEYDESIQLVAEASAVPVYGAWDFSLGYGIVGGLLTSGFSQGEMAAQMAQRILAGEPVQMVPVVMESPTRYMFDYDQMQRFEIPLSDLPPDSVVINRTPTFFELYRGRILLIALGFLGLLGVVFVLLNAVLQRRRTERELLESNRELREVRQTLEQRVEDRTRALAQRAVQLEAAAEVSRATTVLRDPASLLTQVVDLVREHFGLYYVGLFLVEGDDAVLRAGTGRAGEEMLARGHRLEVGGNSMIGQCVANDEPVVSLDVMETDVRFQNPLLPDTRSEMALPMRAGGEVIGALSVQSVEPEAFDAAFISVLQTMADQVAIAIRNARLHAETEVALAEAEAVHRRYQGQAWTAYAERHAVSGYMRADEQVSPLADEVLAPVRQAMASSDIVRAGASPEDMAASVLAASIRPRGDLPVGALGVLAESEDRSWSEDDVALIRTISEQFALAAENLRLVEGTQDLAQREQLISRITSRIRETLELDTVLRTAVQEIREAMGVPELTIRLVSPEATSGDAASGDGASDEGGDATDV
jgi:GAF domain-containing protein/ABC-type uncharacterized transport system substrate-binding protein